MPNFCICFGNEIGNINFRKNTFIFYQFPMIIILGVCLNAFFLIENLHYTSETNRIDIYGCWKVVRFEILTTSAKNIFFYSLISSIFCPAIRTLLCCVIPSFVLDQSSPWLGGFCTNVTWVGDSSDVVGFYVSFYIHTLPLLATYFTDSFSCVSLATSNNSFTNFHHGLDLVIQILQVSGHSVVSDF